MKIHNLKRFISKNPDGFTIGFNDLKPYSLKKGYSVSLTNIKGKNVNTLIKKVLNVGNIGFNSIRNKLFIGGWNDLNNNTFYLDLSIISNNKTEVKFFLKRFNQICCFNFKDFKTYKYDEL